MVGVFTMLGISGLLGGGTLFILMLASANPEIGKYYTGSLEILFTTMLVSLVFLAIAKILFNQEEILDRLRERDSAKPPMSLNKDLGNWPPSP